MASYLALLALSVSSVIAQAPSCSSTLTYKNAAPSVAPGYAAVLVANGLTAPRDIKFDSAGNLLVVEQGKGVTALNIADNGSNCPQASNKKTVIANTALNHGIEIQTNSSGNYLYASSTDVVYRWLYAPATQTNTSEPIIVVNNMTGTDHTTRTLRFSKRNSKILLVTRGSLENLDPEAANEATGVSQIKAFDVSGDVAFPQNFTVSGDLLAWGVRNDVGIDEHPSGLIYSVENSADQVTRGGVDIHENNPGEKLNFVGRVDGVNYTLNGNDRDYGYPYCFAAWDPSAIPNFNGTVGQQFAIDGPNNIMLNDTYCRTLVPPRLVFQAHMAPLDILFNTAGTAAWVTFHGSWDRTNPVGYKLSVVEFTTAGQPVDNSTSLSAAIDIVTNQNETACPDSCFRPVGLAWDARGRLFMSSDSTGEIYAIIRTDGNTTESAGSNSTSSLPSPTVYSGTPLSGGTSTPASSSGTTTGAASTLTSIPISVVSAVSTPAQPPCHEHPGGWWPYWWQPHEFQPPATTT